ncbi:hypothetical protein KCP71_11965 [Salmonella enterica subsp. enterica]|nr:hypothetical protein KCP71_11965 [Salmonella enterica subsp. enterica]
MAQVGEAMAMAKALNRMTLLAMSTSVRPRITSAPVGVLYSYRWPILELFNKASCCHNSTDADKSSIKLL